MTDSTKQDKMHGEKLKCGHKSGKGFSDDSSNECCKGKENSDSNCCSNNSTNSQEPLKNQFASAFQNVSKKNRANFDEEDTYSNKAKDFNLSKSKDSKNQNAKDFEIIEKLEEELETIKRNAEENKSLALRAKAEVENVRRRAKLDVDSAYKYSIEKFAKELLNVFDSFERGIEAHNNVEDNNQQSTGSIEAILEGMKLTHKLLLDTFEKFGLTVIDPIGEEFDPTKHEALSMQENSEAAPNEVLVVIQKGFMLQDRVLRHAKVIIAKSS